MLVLAAIRLVIGKPRNGCYDGDVTVGAIPHSLERYACLDLVNSRLTDHRGGAGVHDRLPSPQWRAWFLDRWGLDLAAAAEPAPLPHLHAVRADLRAVLEAWRQDQGLPGPAVQGLQASVAEAAVRRRVEHANGCLTVDLEPVRRDWAWALAETVISAAQLMSDGDRRRLKICANPGCSWVFYDESRNRGGRWCDAATCGNLVKVREFRRRRS